MLRLQYFGNPVQRTESLEKTLMLGKIEGGRRRGQQRMRWLDGITDSMDLKKDADLLTYLKIPSDTGHISIDKEGKSLILKFSNQEICTEKRVE